MPHCPWLYFRHAEELVDLTVVILRSNPPVFIRKGASRRITPSLTLGLREGCSARGAGAVWLGLMASDMLLFTPGVPPGVDDAPFPFSACDVASCGGDV